MYISKPAVSVSTQGVVSNSTNLEARDSCGKAVGRRLKLLTYNIQTGIASNRYHHYLTNSWKHFLPCAKRLDNLKRIANVLSDFDIVGLQEVDGGSLRSGFINQTEYLSDQARFPYWHDQTNRNLGHLAQHSTGVLSRVRPAEVTEVKLPGMIPGRGALTMRSKLGSGLVFCLPCCIKNHA